MADLVHRVPDPNDAPPCQEVELLQLGADLAERLQRQPWRLIGPAADHGLAEQVRALEARIRRLEEGRAQAPDWPAMVALLGRIADAVAPTPEEVVDSVYVAGKLDCTTTWVAELVRRGEIPRACVVPGTGNGKPWKFSRDRIDAWIAAR